MKVSRVRREPHTGQEPSALEPHKVQRPNHTALSHPKQGSESVANVLKLEKKRMILSMLCEGCSVRSVERLIGVHRDTILRLLVRAGEHCQTIMDREIRDVYTSSIQCDELWTYVGKKERRLLPSDPMEWGDAYTFVGIDRETKMILAFEVGKRSHETTNRFVEVLSKRVEGDVQIFSDGYTPYRFAIPHYFGRRAHFAQVVKHFDGDSNEEHRYSPAGIASVEHVWVQGFPKAGQVSTSHVERSNWTIRGSLRRFTRLSNGFSRKLDNLKAAFSLFACWFNWVKKHSTIGMTPAMAMGLACEPWSIDRLIPSKM